MKYTDNIIIDLYNLGLNDKEIGERIGKSHTYVRLIRLELGILSHSQVRRQKIKDQIKDLTNLGYTDKKIGNIMGLNHRTVMFHRKSMDIAASMPELNYQNDYDRIRGYMIRNSKFMSKRRNIEFNLHYTDFELPDCCPILGIKLKYRRESDGNSYDHATLDRINNNIGYTKGNVIVISRLANSMKNQANFDQIRLFSTNMIKLINYYENQGALGSITDVFSAIKLRKLSLDS